MIQQKQLIHCVDVNEWNSITENIDQESKKEENKRAEITSKNKETLSQEEEYAKNHIEFLKKRKEKIEKIKEKA